MLLIPPAGILAVLGGLSLTVSPRFTPGFFVFGIAAGMVAGFCEELGWTGLAYPRMQARFGWLPGALLLGVLWGLWHLPVVDSLGAAAPAEVPHPHDATTSREPRNSGGLCLVGNAKKLRWHGITGWHRIRRGTGPRLAGGGSRSSVTGSRQPGRPPFRARHGVLAVPADVGAGLPAIGHNHADRQRDAAQ